MRADDQYHAGIVVDDLDAAMAELGELFGYEWCPEFAGRVAVRVPEGDIEIDLRFVFSRTTPRIEVIQSIGGTVWTPAAGSGVHHLGYWCDDVAGDGARLERAGYAMEAAGLNGGAPYWAYYRAPTGPRIELVDRGLKPSLEQMWAAAPAPER